MSTVQKIQELTNIIAHSNDPKLINLVYALVKEYQQEDNVTLSKEQKGILKERIANRKSGKTHSMTLSEVQSKLKAI